MLLSVMPGFCFTDSRRQDAEAERTTQKAKSTGAGALPIFDYEESLWHYSLTDRPGRGIASVSPENPESELPAPDAASAVIHSVVRINLQVLHIALSQSV